MRCFTLGFLGLLVLWPACRAMDPPKDKDKPDKKPTAHEQYQALDKQFNEAFQPLLKEVRAAAQQAKTPEERKKVIAKYMPKARALAGDYASKFLKLAKDHPQSPAAMDALVWVIQRVDPGSVRNQAIELLIKDQAKNKQFVRILPLFSEPTAANEKWLRQILAAKPDHQAQGLATLTLGQVLEGLHKDKEAERYYERAVKDYKDVDGPEGNVADVAQSQLYELQHLAVGMVAPNITGEDADGKKFQLSDYRGKVVVLDFWGEW